MLVITFSVCLEGIIQKKKTSNVCNEQKVFILFFDGILSDKCYGLSTQMMMLKSKSKGIPAQVHLCIRHELMQCLQFCAHRPSFREQRLSLFVVPCCFCIDIIIIIIVFNVNSQTSISHCIACAQNMLHCIFLHQKWGSFIKSWFFLLLYFNFTSNLSLASEESHEQGLGISQTNVSLCCIS